MRRRREGVSIGPVDRSIRSDGGGLPYRSHRITFVPLWYIFDHVSIPVVFESPNGPRVRVLVRAGSALALRTRSPSCSGAGGVGVGPADATGVLEPSTGLPGGSKRGRPGGHRVSGERVARSEATRSVRVDRPSEPRYSGGASGTTVFSSEVRCPTGERRSGTHRISGELPRSTDAHSIVSARTSFTTSGSSRRVCSV